MGGKLRKSARGIIVKDGKIAVIHRINNGREYYTTPGGGVEEGESLEEALIREVKEETGLEVKGCKLVFHEEWNGGHFYYYQCHVNGEQLIMTGPEAEPNPGQFYKPEWMEIKDTEKMALLKPDKVKEYLVE